MSYQATAWVAERSKAKGSELLVLFIIANHAHPDGTGSWPAIKTIAAESKMSPRGVQHIIKRLEDLGDLEVTRLHTGGDNWSGRNEYTIPGVRRDSFYQDKQIEEDAADDNLAHAVQTQPTRSPDATHAQSRRQYSAQEVEVELEPEIKPMEPPSVEVTTPRYGKFSTLWTHLTPQNPSKTKKNKELYSQACQKLGEEKVLEAVHKYIVGRDDDFLSKGYAVIQFLEEAVYEIVEASAMKKAEEAGEKVPIWKVKLAQSPEGKEWRRIYYSVPEEKRTRIEKDFISTHWEKFFNVI